MALFNKVLQDYIEKFTEQEPTLLASLTRMTYTKSHRPQMLSGHFQGRVLATFSQMIKPNRILEIGTYTGYSAICLAEGLKEGGVLYTIDINEEFKEMVQMYFAQAGIKDNVNYCIGNALEIIPQLNEIFDLVFIDADKKRYDVYYDLVLEKLRPGGFIIVDNVLWRGEVFLEREVNQTAQTIRNFNKKVQEDHRVENVLFPIRDGLMVLRKK